MTTIRINLLPYREQQRAMQQKAFVGLLAGVSVSALLIVGMGHVLIANMKESQEARNVFLRDEISKLDGQIKEIAVLKEKTNALLAKKKVVESLQSNRSEAVHLFDDLARQIPDGLYLKSLKQTGNKLALQGYAQSSARVSTFMRNLEASNWFASPILIEVSAATTPDKVRVQQFSLTVTQQSLKADETEGDQPKAR